MLSVGCVVSSVFVDLLLKTEQLIVFVMQVVSVKTNIYSFVQARSCQSHPQAVWRPRNQDIPSSCWYSEQAKASIHFQTFIFCFPVPHFIVLLPITCESPEWSPLLRTSGQRFGRVSRFLLHSACIAHLVLPESVILIDVNKQCELFNYWLRCYFLRPCEFRSLQRWKYIVVFWNQEFLWAIIFTIKNALTFIVVMKFTAVVWLSSADWFTSVTYLALSNSQLYINEVLL